MAEPSPNVIDDNNRSVYAPSEDAAQTRQAQHTQANDTPTDVNPNAVMARGQTMFMAAAANEQVATLTLMGKNFESHAMMWKDLMAAKMARIAALPVT